MGRQRSCTNLWWRFPPDPAKMGGESGYISGRFAIGSSDFFSFSDDDFIYTDPEASSPLTRLAAGPSDLDLLGWSAFSTRPSIAAVLVPFAAAIRRFSRKFLKEQIGVLMPRRYCGSCRSPLHADDGHSECVSCLGKSHADAALAGSDCSHCESISLASLRSWIAFFSESDPAPRALPFSSSQGPVRKKQRGRGSQRPVESELTPAQIPRVSLSPHREVSPVLFFQPDQHPSASASDLVSFRGSDDELADDSMSLAASDAEELSGSITDPAPSRLPAPSAAKAGMDAKLFRVLSKAVKELGLEWSPPEEPSRSRLDEWFLPGRRQAPQQRPSPFFPEVHDELTRSWRSPYSARLRTSASSTLTIIDGAEEKRYERMPQLDESVAAHLCPPTAIGRRRRPVNCPSHAGPLQHSLDAPTLQLDRRLRRSTLWRFYRSIRPSSSLPQTSLSLILRLSGSWEVQQTWLCEPDHRPSHRKVYGRPGGARAPPVAHADGD